MKNNSHGGKREGAGRHPLEGDPMKRRFPMATDNLWNFIAAIGDGNASKGLRVMRDMVVLFDLGFSFDEAKAIIENGDDTYELQCPKCHQYWAYFDKEYKRGICPKCGNVQ